MSTAIVYHGFYGCDTGCCGHYVEIDDVEVKWTFAHPNDDFKEWAEDLVREFGEEHVADLDWENCRVSDD